MLDLRLNTFAEIRTRMVELLPAFCMLKCRNHAHAILLQLSLFEYWEHNEHPAMKMFARSPEILCGDNIELCNRLLSQHSSDNSRRSNFDLLAKAFPHLGILLHHGMAMQEDLHKTISLHKDTTRYTFKNPDPRIM